MSKTLRIEWYEVDTDSCRVSVAMFVVDGFTYRTEVEGMADELHIDALLISVNKKHPQLSAAFGVSQKHFKKIINGFIFSKDEFTSEDHEGEAFDGAWPEQCTTEYFGFIFKVAAIDLEITNDKMAWFPVEDTQERFTRLLNDMIIHKFADYSVNISIT